MEKEVFVAARLDEPDILLAVSYLMVPSGICAFPVLTG